MAVRTPANQGHTYPVETLTPQEVQALLQACLHRAPTGIRNRALLTLLWRSGLRISEALALYPRDLDPQQGSVRVRRGKGGKARLVGLDPQAFAMVQRWLDQRHSLGLTGRAPVFCTLAGKPLQTSYIRTLLPRLARRAGIDKRVHAHGLRHTHAAELAAERVPINQIQQQLGHASLATTSRFGSYRPANIAGDATPAHLARPRSCRGLTIEQTRTGRIGVSRWLWASLRQRSWRVAARDDRQRRTPT